MTKKFGFLSLLFLFLFSSCLSLSDTAIVPGEEEIVKHNISSEYFTIASSYRDAKNYKKAVEYYEMAMSDDSLKDSCEYEIGMCLVRQKEWNKAVPYFERLLEKDPENLSLQSSLVYIEAMRGNLVKAENSYRDLAEKYPKDERLAKNYILVLWAEKKEKEAVEELKKFEKNFPKSENLKTLKEKIKIEEVSEDKSSVATGNKK